METWKLNPQDPFCKLKISSDEKIAALLAAF